MKTCVLEEKICNGCGECDKCDLNPKKTCDNCGKCLDIPEIDYATIEIEEIKIN